MQRKYVVCNTEKYWKMNEIRIKNVGQKQYFVNIQFLIWISVPWSYIKNVSVLYKCMLKHSAEVCAIHICY